MQCCGFLTLVGNGGTAVGDLGVYHPPQASPVKMQHMAVVLSWARIDLVLSQFPSKPERAKRDVRSGIKSIWVSVASAFPEFFSSLFW